MGTADRVEETPSQRLERWQLETETPSQRLERWQLETGLTQGEFAEEIGMRCGSFSRLIRGARTPMLRTMIAAEMLRKEIGCRNPDLEPTSPQTGRPRTRVNPTG